MRLYKSSVGTPHNFVEFPEFAKETRIAVIDTLSILAQLRMFILLNIPYAVWESCTLRASDLLLLVTPIWEFDFVGEENTPSHGMNELELGLNSAESSFRLGSFREVLDNLNTEDIICITFKSLVPIG